MKESYYEPPTITVQEIEVENGIAYSVFGSEGEAGGDIGSSNGNMGW